MSHVHSSVSNPESQGALERFHQTLKFDKDWDEGVPLPLFAMREVVQETEPGSLRILKAHTDRTAGICDAYQKECKSK